MKQSGSRGGILGLREWLNFLWRLFGLIGAVLGLRRWWRTLTDREEQKSTRLLAGVLLVLMVALIVLSVVRPHGSVDGGTATATPTPTPRQMVVDFRDDVPLSTISQLGGELGVAFEPNSPLVDSDKVMLASVPSAAAGERLLARLRGDARVSAADHNDTYHLFGWQVRPRAARVARQVGPGMTPNDPRYAEQWNFPLIGMPAAWEKATGKGVVVAVIDTGCAFEREGDIPAASDLKQTKFTKPYDFVNHRKRAYDDHGHGTHVAGTIAQSTNNQHGVAGIAYEATIMPLKVLGAGGSGTVADIAEAIEYAANQGAHIINMSLGGPRGNAVMRRACTYANQRGVTIVCSAGNSGRQGVGYPAAYPECIAVSSVGPTGELAFYSARATSGRRAATTAARKSAATACSRTPCLASATCSSSGRARRWPRPTSPAWPR